MRAAVYEEFRGPVEVRQVSDPSPAPDGVVLAVGATGVCRSDWHGWMGHDPDIALPHVPGHETAGTVVAVGTEVAHFRIGDRVTLPFACGCGMCAQCVAGNHQVCDAQFQPGFTAWGSYAEYVAIRYADTNLVRLPETLDFVTAASLGCRFATSYRAVVLQGKVAAGDWVAVHGCGGVGLSAVMIAASLGAQVIAIDIRSAALELARDVGAVATIDARAAADVVEAIDELSGGGARLSIDALGSEETLRNSVACLRKRGRHVQVGLLGGTAGVAPLPMDLVISKELEIVGSHGLQAHHYGRLLGMITTGDIDPGRLVGRRIGLDMAAHSLHDPEAGHGDGAGIAVIDRF